MSRANPERIPSAPNPTGPAPVGVRAVRGVLTEAPLVPHAHVRILLQDGQEERFDTDDALARDVFALRGAEVVAMCTRGERPRVIWLHTADAAPAALSADALLQDSLVRWAETLEILGR